MTATLHYTDYTAARYNCNHATLHNTTLHWVHRITLQLQLQLQLQCSCNCNYHYITLRYTTLHYTYYTTLHDATLHYTTLRYTTLHILHDTTRRDTTLHYTAPITLHYTTTTTTLPYTKLHYTVPHYTTLHYATLRYATLHNIMLRYTTLITPHHDYKCNCACQKNDFTTLQLQLRYTTLQLQLQLQLQLRYTTLHPAVAVRWPLQPLQPFQKTQLQPPVGPSVDSLCHPWFTTTNLSYRFPIFETSATALFGATGSFLGGGWRFDWTIKEMKANLNKRVITWLTPPVGSVHDKCTSEWLNAHTPSTTYSPPQCLGSLAGMV